MRLCIGCPSKGQLRKDMVAHLFQLSIHYIAEIGEPPKILFTDCRVEIGRNMCADYAIKEDCTHLLFIDSDMAFPADGWKILADADKDIIGCNAAKRVTGAPVIEDDIDGNPLDYVKYPRVEVDFIGMAFTMIKIEALKKMEIPWFFAPPCKGNVHVTSEDAWFCKSARNQYGIKTFCHLDLSRNIGHEGQITRYLTKHVQPQADRYKMLIEADEFRERVNALFKK